MGEYNIFGAARLARTGIPRGPNASRAGQMAKPTLPQGETAESAEQARTTRLIRSEDDSFSSPTASERD